MQRLEPAYQGVALTASWVLRGIDPLQLAKVEVEVLAGASRVPVAVLSPMVVGDATELAVTLLAPASLTARWPAGRLTLRVVLLRVTGEQQAFETAAALWPKARAGVLGAVLLPLAGRSDQVIDPGDGGDPGDGDPPPDVRALLASATLFASTTRVRVADTTYEVQ